MRPGHRALLAALAVVLLGVTGCAVGPSVRPPIATRYDGPPAPPATDDAPSDDAPKPPLLPPLLATTAPNVPFADCTPEVRATVGTAALGGRDLRFECATIAVSGRGTASPAELSVVRVTLGPPNPAGAAPVVTVGEPGGSVGSDEAIRVAAQAPPEMLREIAVYGVDLRGTGASEPVDCITPTTREAMTDADPRAADPAALRPLRDAAATAARTCTQILENGLTDYRAAVGAEDLEQVRLALGVPQLHAVGLGSGAGMVAEWALRYPDSVGRVVLDGLPDPSSTTSQRADEQSRAAREALGAFASDCTARPSCPLGPDPVATVSDTLARLRAAPLTGPDGRRVTDGTATHALLAGLERPSGWAGTAAAVAAARNGDPGPLLGLLGPREADGGGFDADLITSCNDTAERLTIDQIAATAAQARRDDPVFGAFFAQQATLCTAWPVPAEAPTLSPRPGPPALMLGTGSDPRVPLASTQRAATSLRTVTLVTWLGAGHGAYPGTPCVQNAVTGYLLGGDLPRQATVCPP